MSPAQTDQAGAAWAHPEPFGISELRASVLRAWRDSPTRLTEDTNAEYDLGPGAYRDRLLVELAQNAADAAAGAGEPGCVRLHVEAGELRCANTGEPLDADGVAALASLRASPKRGDRVGRFGVGFAAVLAVTDEPRLVSRTGGFAFSKQRSEQALAGEIAPDRAVPVLRLPWPLAEDEAAVPAGYDTEVRMRLRPEIDADALLAELSGQVPDLLLALGYLARVEIAGAVWTRVDTGDGFVELHGPDGEPQRWLAHQGSAQRCVWTVPVDADGVPRPLETDLLHAPTPTDERLSLPARLIAELPMEPSRRRVRPGDELYAALERAATGYLELLSLMSPAQVLALVPAPGFPVSDIDATLRELITERMSSAAWLPAADGRIVSAGAARVLAADSAALLDLLAGLVPGVLAAPLCGSRAVGLLSPLGAARLPIAEAVDAMAGITRPSAWWRACYDALLELLDAREIAAEELGGLATPLADGRALPGPRDALLPEVSAETLRALADAEIVGMRILHPDAAHPLLRRLGARTAGAGELLAEPALLDAVRRSVDDARAGLDCGGLVDAVLRLVAEGGRAAGLGALALPARSGSRRADELVLPGSELLELFDADVFGADCPLDVLEVGFAERIEADVLTRVGVLDGFAVLADDEPAEPDHDLPDESRWWSGLTRLPDQLVAVRDLDLVADGAWPATLRLLAVGEHTWRALTEVDGHTGWWIARNALLAGEIPLYWRMPDAGELAGIYDPLPDVGISDAVARAAGVRETLPELGAADDEAVADAVELLERLGDPERGIQSAKARRVHSALAAMDVAPDELPAPDLVRTLAGSVAPAAKTTVLDGPWWLGAWPAERLVAAERYAEAERLAELLDLPLTSELSACDVRSEGDYLPWNELAAVREVVEALDIPLPERSWPGVVLHERLTVAVDDVAYDVEWWVDAKLHAQDSPAGLARALAWAAGQWSRRYLIAALLDDPGPATLLG